MMFVTRPPHEHLHLLPQGSHTYVLHSSPRSLFHSLSLEELEEQPEGCRAAGKEKYHMDDSPPPWYIHGDHC
jgi:hypothetical protein